MELNNEAADPDGLARLRRLEELPGYWAGRAAVRRQVVRELESAAQYVAVLQPARAPASTHDLSAAHQIPLNLRGAAAGAVHQEVRRNTRILIEYEREIRARTQDHQQPDAGPMAGPAGQARPLRAGADL